MFDAVFDVNDGLLSSRRFGGLTRAGERVTAIELATLVTCGMLAAVSAAVIDTPGQIPGQSILQSLLPMVFGLALVPRRLAGSVVGVGSMLAVAGFRVGGFQGVGPGAMTSLFLTGPMLDAALWTARSGWRLYARIVLAGIATNALALAMRFGTKLLSGDTSGGRRLASWLPVAIWTYPICGVIAGAISALAFFHWASQRAAASDRAEP